MNNRPLKNTKLNNEILPWQEFLKKHSACESGYLEASDKLPQQWWDMTERPDWMIWVLKKLPQYKEDKRIWIRIALVCAKETVHLAKDPQQRPQKAIEAVEQWLLDPSEENRLKCRVVASAAKDYAASAAYASAASAASASASTSASASYAYASASYAASAASAVSIRKGICEKIREIIPQLVIGVI